MGYALVFSGQGAQHAAMLPWLERDETMVEVERQLGADWRERLADPAWAGKSLHAQVLLTGCSLAAWRQLAPQLAPPAIVAGYSVGELAAFAAAGVYDAKTALGLAASRAQAMDAAAEAEPTGLLGVSAPSPEAIDRWRAAFELEVAIRIAPGNVVVGGRRADLADAIEAAATSGVRCTPLNIAMSSHTRWMREATDRFAEVLSSVAMRRPATALHSGAIGRVRTEAQAREALAVQLSRTVQWDDCLDAVAAQRVDAVLEIGPGRALARMWEERCPDVPARSVDEFRTAAAIGRWLDART